LAERLIARIARSTLVADMPDHYPAAPPSEPAWRPLPASSLRYCDGVGAAATIETSDPRFTEGLLNLAEAGRYLRVPQQTFHRWARGYERGKPLLHVLDPASVRLPVTFVALAEGHVLDALREAGVRPHKIRPALKALQKEFGRDYVLVAPELATDGIDVLWDFSKSRSGSGLIAADTGQHVIREIVEDHMSYIAWDRQRLPRELTLREWLPSKVIVNVRRSFGQPIFAGTGVRVADVAGMVKAGENAETVADEFGIAIGDVRTAARILLGRAA
jgi:uncharacterized protein (DUF433 family)